MRRAGGGALRLGVAEATRWLEFGNNGGAGGFRRGYAVGRTKMRAFSHKNRGNVATFGLNVATFPRVKLPTSRR